MTIKTASQEDFAGTIRVFAQTMREDAGATGFCDITAYREIRPDGTRGAISLDQAVCTTMLADAKRRQAADQRAALAWAIRMMERNDFADWTILVEFANTDQA